MAAGLETLSLQDELDEYPQPADLRKIFSEQPLPNIPPGTIDPESLAGEEPTNQALAVLKTLNDALAAGDSELVESCFFAEQSYWKDQLALTYHLRTFASPSVVAAGLLETKTLRGLGAFEVKGKAQFIPATPVLQWIDCAISFKTSTPAATCSGKIVLLPVVAPGQENGKSSATWKIWVLSTKLDGFDLYPEDESLLQTPGKNLEGLETISTNVLIVGGGNAAVALAARLKALGVDAIMADRNPRPGDNWALRYDAMKFHIPTSFCELPYMTYEKELQTPHLLTRDDLADQVRRYVATFNLAMINSAEVIQTAQLPDKQWSVKLQTPSGIRTVNAKHVVQATGIASQKPYIPSLADEKLYNGIKIHSTKYKNASELKKQGASSVLIVGSANTAFDVLEECYNEGLQSKMVVRSPTYMCPIEYVCDPRSLGAYDFGVEEADNMFLTLPTAVDGQLARNLFAFLASEEPDRYKALAAAGFPIITSSDVDTALMHNLLERAGGHYIDTGATKLIAEGKVGIKANTEPVAYTATGLRFSDGSTVDADAVVWCTGFSDKNARNTTSEIFKMKIPVDATWGIDKEGEVRGMWKRQLGVDNFWIMGGYTQQHRWHSKTLALQIKAALQAVLPPAYRKTPEPRVTAK